MSDTTTYWLDLAGTGIGLACDAELAEGLARWFGRPSADVEPTIQLELSYAAHNDLPKLPNSLVTTKTLGPDGTFDIADGLITGRWDRAARRGEVCIKEILLEGRYPRIFEQVLYQAWYSACEATGREGFLIHSSAVIADGRGFIFVGPSETGKTTAARNSADWSVLGDEMSLVVPSANGLDLVGTPFNGLFREKVPGRAPLTAVFLLKQALHHRLSAVAPAEAVTNLMAEIAPPVGLDRMPDAGTLPAMAAAAESLLEHADVQNLELLPNPGFWQEIETRYALVRPGGRAPTKGR